MILRGTTEPPEQISVSPCSPEKTRGSLTPLSPLLRSEGLESPPNGFHKVYPVVSPRRTTEPPKPMLHLLHYAKGQAGPLSLYWASLLCLEGYRPIDAAPRPRIFPRGTIEPPEHMSFLAMSTRDTRWFQTPLNPAAPP